MMHNKDVAKNLWSKAVNTTCHIVNKVYFNPRTKKTHMNYGNEENQMSSISEYLVALASF